MSNDDDDNDGDEDEDDDDDDDGDFKIWLQKVIQLMLCSQTAGP